MPFDAVWCRVMPSDAEWCRLMPIDADWCCLVLFGADWCWVVLINADQCWLVQIGADWCWLILRDAREWYKFLLLHIYWTDEKATDQRKVGGSESRHLLFSLALNSKSQPGRSFFEVNWSDSHIEYWIEATFKPEKLFHSCGSSRHLHSTRGTDFRSQAFPLCEINYVIC